MIKLLDKENNYVIVKMDISTYEKISKEEKKWKFDDLIVEAKASKAYNSIDELFNDLNN